MALFSRKNLKIPSLSFKDIEDNYRIVVCEYLTNYKKDPRTAFSIFDNSSELYTSIVYGYDNSWYTTAMEENRTVLYLNNFFLSKNVKLVNIYCCEKHDYKIFNDLNRTLVLNNFSKYDPEMLRAELLDIIKPYTIISPEQIIFQ